MTRETKIGLLVGLAFIIVIGILIADYSANSMRRPPAPMLDAMQNVLDSANNPGVRRAIGQAPRGAIAPQRMIGQDVRQTTPEIQVVPPAQSDPPVRIEGGSRGQQVSSAGPGRMPPVLLVPDDRADAKSHDAAANSREDNSEPKPAGNVKEIVAVEKDTVYKWAKVYLGAPTPANIEAIISANPNLKGNKPIRIGDKYKIPLVTPPATPRDRDNATPPAPPIRPERLERTEPTSVADGMDRPTTIERTDHTERTETPDGEAKVVIYTTKRGDSLWKIAERQCGDGRLASKIRELNNLPNDKIEPEMTLKLPAKGT